MSPAHILAVRIAGAYGLSLDDLTAKSRRRSIVPRVRRIVALVLNRSGCSHARIARVLNRERSTITHLLRI